MQSLFDQFLQEKRYLTGVSKGTLTWYQQSFKNYLKYSDPERINRFTLNMFVMGQRQAGLSAVSINDSHCLSCHQGLTRSELETRRRPTQRG
jgi:hypothetical protein